MCCKVTHSDCIYENNSKINTSPSHSKKKSLIQLMPLSFQLLALEIIWRLNLWKTRELDCFLEESNPDVIFAIVSSTIYYNRIVRYVTQILRKKLILFFVDDSYSYQAIQITPINILHRFFLRNVIDQMVSLSKHILVISPLMKQEFDNLFKTHCILITKGANIGEVSIKTNVHNPLRLLYVGNLNYGRKNTIIEIAKTVKKLNEQNTNIVLKIYSLSHLSKKEIFKLNSYGQICFHSPIPYQDIMQVQSQSDILLYIESFRKKYYKITRLSFSTKLTDYLNSGKVIMAIGPNEIASIAYLKSQGAAITISHSSQILPVLGQVLSNPMMLNTYRLKAYECCLKNHRKELIQQRLTRVLFDT